MSDYRSNIATHFVVRTARSQRQLGERRLEQITVELRFLVVKPDTTVAVCALLRALGELLGTISSLTYSIKQFVVTNEQTFRAVTEL